MNKGTVQVIYGPGKGKTAAALGYAVQSLDCQKTAIVIQFMKGNLESQENSILKRLEPELKIFRFEKLAACFKDLTEQERQEEAINMKNGVNFANKVLTTGECDILILDEVLGLLDCQIITPLDLRQMISNKADETELILTGQSLPDGFEDILDEIYRIDNVKVDKVNK